MPVKRVALVSEGPSARETYPGADGYDEVVGVNRVPTVWPCTWWAFLDPEFYMWSLNEEVLGEPRILTNRRLERAINTGRLLAKGLRERFEADRRAGRITVENEVPLLPPMPRQVPIVENGPDIGKARWTQHGGLAGLVCAWLAGGTGATVDIYGADMHGTDDALGEDGKGRIEKRWKTERRIFKGLIRGFERAGELNVNWIAPPHLADICRKD